MRGDDIGRQHDSGTPAPEPAGALAIVPDLDGPEYYLNRELTWLEFNRRVLHESEDVRAPLFERVKFLAIFASNLDQFFMKRIGGLKQLVGAGVRERSIDGRTPHEQLDACAEVVRELEGSLGPHWVELRARLERAGVRLARGDEIGDAERTALREHFADNIYPLVTPQSIDSAHPFPFISGLSLNLLVTLQAKKGDPEVYARVKVPVGSGIPRFLPVEMPEQGDERVFVPLEEVLADNLDLLFPSMRVVGCETFRVTRNANLTRNDDQADDLMAMIESELRERRFAPIVRLEVEHGMKPAHRAMLAAELGLDAEADVYEGRALLGLADLAELARLDHTDPDLHDAPHRPVDPPDLAADQSVFRQMRDSGPILLHHPYESFGTSIERLVQEAAADPQVRAIKMTLYRTAGDSRLLEHLIDAATNGKQVALAVELQARFDESANIALANRMEEAGIHVSYGVLGLKTHCKVLLVIRQEDDGLRRYAHVGTGNYHSGTARLYADLGLLTCSRKVGEDLTELFNFLTTGYKPRRKYKKLLVAPVAMKAAILEKIEREAAHALAGRPAHIRFKLNALEDPEVTRALYRAARSGVRIELLIRDTCRLRPGLPGISERVRVVSIVGRFLEHARVLFFENGGDPEYFIGSADCMTRNLEMRVEALVPVEDEESRRRLRFMMETQLADRRSAWDMRPDGSYVQRKPTTEEETEGSQQRMIRWTEERAAQSAKRRRRGSRGGRRRDR